MSTFKPVHPIRVDTSCCAGYKEFTFAGINFPLEINVLNSAASNYIHADVTPSGLSTFIVTFPSLEDKVLSEMNTQILPGIFSGAVMTATYNGDNTVSIQWADLGAITGIFSIRIWTAFVEDVV